MNRIIQNCLTLFMVFNLQSQSYGVTIDVDTSQAPQLADFVSKVKQTLIQWYPIVSKELSSPNYTPPNNVRISFDPNYNGVAYSSGNKIVGGVQYYTNHRDDIGSMVHQATYIIQSYKKCPDWIRSGIADWIRYYKYEPSRMPSKPKSSDSYTMGYGISAYFLQYIINNTPQWSAPYHMVYWVNKDCREGTYNDSMWPRMTGKSLEEHWKNMVKDDVTIDIDTSKAPQLATFASKVKKTLMAWYPIVSKELSSPNFNPPNYLRIRFDPNYNGVAYAAGTEIVGSVQYYTNHEDDVGSMVHEMTHVIQSYRTAPSWLTEGIADWIRYYKYEPSRMPSKPKSSDSYTMGYGISSYFLQYIINNTPQWSAPYHMVYWANKDCREGTYNDSMWPRMTGKTLDQLWQDMMDRG